MNYRTIIPNVFLIAVLSLVCYNLIFLPSDIRGATARKEYLAGQLRQHLIAKESDIMSFAHDEIGISELFTFRVSAIDVNFVRNFFDVHLEIHDSTGEFSMKDVLKSEKFTKFFHEFPEILIAGLENEERYLFQYTFDLRSASGLYMSIEMPSRELRYD